MEAQNTDLSVFLMRNGKLPTPEEASDFQAKVEARQPDDNPITAPGIDEQIASDENKAEATAQPTTYTVRGYQYRTPKGDIIIANPFTGNPSTNSEGVESYITKDCLAGYPYALVEFDALSFGQQCAFWLGFLQKSKYRDLLASLVFSGGKSIHGLLRINASDIFAQGAWRTRLHNLFSSNPNKSLCADPAGFLPRQGTRLAGALRNGDGPVQELLYLRPQFATETPVIGRI